MLLLIVSATALPVLAIPCTLLVVCLSQIMGCGLLALALTKRFLFVAILPPCGRWEATKPMPDLSKVSELDDGFLVTRAQAGDRRAFSELVRRHQSSVYRVCYRVLGDREDARDATQEAFVRAFRRLDSFEGRSAFRTWMLRVAMNVSLNERAKRKELPSQDMLPDPLPDPEAEVIASEQVDRLHRALQLIEPDQRAAIVLHDLEGLTYEEAAQTLGVPEGTVKSWAHRGRRRLKELLT